MTPITRSFYLTNAMNQKGSNNLLGMICHGIWNMFDLKVRDVLDWAREVSLHHMIRVEGSFRNAMYPEIGHACGREAK